MKPTTGSGRHPAGSLLTRWAWWRWVLVVAVDMLRNGRNTGHWQQRALWRLLRPGWLRYGKNLQAGEGLSPW